MTIDDEEVIVIAGGQKANSEWLNITQILIPSKGIVRLGFQMNTPRRYASMATMDNIVYICGGDGQYAGLANTCERLTSSGKWEYIASTIYEIGDNTISAMLASTKHLYLIHTFNSAMERYSPTTNTWSIMPSPPFGNVYYAGAAILDQYMFVCGGMVSTGNRCYRYSITEAKWTTVASMTNQANQFFMLAMGNKLYALGGASDTPFYKSVQVYDVNANTWGIGVPLIQDRLQSTGVVLEH